MATTKNNKQAIDVRIHTRTPTSTRAPTHTQRCLHTLLICRADRVSHWLQVNIMMNVSPRCVPGTSFSDGMALPSTVSSTTLSGESGDDGGATPHAVDRHAVDTKRAWVGVRHAPFTRTPLPPTKPSALEKREVRAPGTRAVAARRNEEANRREASFPSQHRPTKRLATLVVVENMLVHTGGKAVRRGEADSFATVRRRNRQTMAHNKTTKTM